MDSLIECPVCNETFDEPLSLPCGHSICKEHEMKKNDQEKMLKKVTCPICVSEHDVPDQGFPSNVVVQNLIKFNLNQLDLGDEHSVAVKSFRHLKRLVDELKRMRENPELEIHRVFDELRNEIDLRREEAKESLDDEALELISELDELEGKCKAGLKDSLVISNETEELIRSLESEIPTWDNHLKTFKKNIKRLIAIHKDTVAKCEPLRRANEDIKKQLFDTDELGKIVDKKNKFCQENTKPLM